MRNRRKADSVASYLVLESGTRTLLYQRGPTSNYLPGHWSLVAGGLEKGEEPHDTIIREAEEEAGIRLRKEDLKLVHRMHREQHDHTGPRADYFFRATRWEGEITNCEPHKCERIEWFERGPLPEPMVPHVAVALRYIEHGVVSSKLTNEFFRIHGLLKL